MRTPRDLNGEELAKLLRRYDYEVTRQAGSHMRLTTTRNGEHHPPSPSAESGYAQCYFARCCSTF